MFSVKTIKMLKILINYKYSTFLTNLLFFTANKHLVCQFLLSVLCVFMSLLTTVSCKTQHSIMTSTAENTVITPLHEHGKNLPRYLSAMKDEMKCECNPHPVQTFLPSVTCLDRSKRW
jgi:hypothetical protein